MAGRPRPAGAMPTPPRRRRAVAVDGKTLRGARHAPAGCQVHLLAAMDHTTRAVLAQRQVDGAPGEVPGFQPLLAASTSPQRWSPPTRSTPTPTPPSSSFPASRRTTCSPSRPTSPPCWTAAPTCLAPRPRAGPHPRPRPRPHRAAHPQGGLGPSIRVPARRPGHPQDPRPARQRPAVAHRDRLRDQQPHLRPAQPCPARRPPAGHWAIENGLHYARDVTFAEDASRSARTPSRGPWPACAASPSASCGGTSQYRRRAAAQRPRRHQSPAPARHHKPVKPTLRHHAGP